MNEAARRQTTLGDLPRHNAACHPDKRVFSCFVDALPRNPSGKLLQRQLRRTHENLFPG